METLITILPTFNACLNATSALCLLTGFLAIRAKRKVLHQRCMLSALTASTLFLVGYLTRMALTGTHHFGGDSWVRFAYLGLLFSHMILAVALLPMVGRSLFFAANQRFADHRRIARWTFPTWMYVSVTGVVVYFLLYHVAPRLSQ